MPTALRPPLARAKDPPSVSSESYDALPGITQTDSPKREEREDATAGHACGHHLFGTGSAAAAIAVKHWMEDNDVAGTLRFYGCPAEEGGAGKVYLVRAGLFDDVDAVIHWQPLRREQRRCGLLAIELSRLSFVFTGSRPMPPPLPKMAARHSMVWRP